MKKCCYLLLLSFGLSACGKSEAEPDNETYTPCGTYTSGQKLYKGSKGGCFYYNNNNNKTYVNRSECNC